MIYIKKKKEKIQFQKNNKNCKANTKIWNTNNNGTSSGNIEIDKFHSNISINYTFQSNIDICNV